VASGVGISFKPWPWGGSLMGGGEVVLSFKPWPKVSCFKQKTPKTERAKRKERAERRRERKIFGRNERRERNFRNKYQLVRVGSEMKNIDILIFTKCTVAFHF
jgi:hypothetical protein